MQFSLMTMNCLLSRSENTDMKAYAHLAGHQERCLDESIEHLDVFGACAMKLSRWLVRKCLTSDCVMAEVFVLRRAAGAMFVHCEGSFLRTPVIFKGGVRVAIALFQNWV